MKNTTVNCDDCGKKLTGHYKHITVVIVGKKREIDLCAECLGKRVSMGFENCILGSDCPDCHGSTRKRDWVGNEPCGKSEYEWIDCPHPVHKRLDGTPSASIEEAA